jgi:hypothetical protein
MRGQSGWELPSSLDVVLALFRHVTAGKEPHDPIWTTKCHAALRARRTTPPHPARVPVALHRSAVCQQRPRGLYADLPRHTDFARTRQTRAVTSGVKQRAASANGNKLPNAQKEDGMTCPAAITRRYETDGQVREYLASRGFRRTPEGWRNGRWIGRVSSDDRGFRVEVWLPNA